jgi:hypothetical protein
MKRVSCKRTELQREALDRMVAKCEVGDAINEIDDPQVLLNRLGTRRADY